jgi:hypothetical protein
MLPGAEPSGLEGAQDAVIVEHAIVRAIARERS